MFFAINSLGDKVFSENAVKNEKYFCPVCKNEVIIKQGEVRISHFSHVKKCADDWTYEMSEWHTRMQSYFSDEFREVVITNNGETHRADVLKDGVVLEFQHSNISTEEFVARNEFYRASGYKVVWVFDLSEQWDSKNVQYDKFQDCYIDWKYPKKILREAPRTANYGGDYRTCFYWNDDPSIDYIKKVRGTKSDNFGKPDYSRCLLSENEIEMKKDMNLDEAFFQQPKEPQIDVPFKYKLSFIGGGKKEDDKCERYNLEWLKVSGENGCAYCKYCKDILQTSGYKKGYRITCCYPIEVREPDNPEPGYECGRIIIRHE